MTRGAWCELRTQLLLANVMEEIITVAKPRSSPRALNEKH
jgi:hypothetical protein